MISNWMIAAGLPLVVSGIGCTYFLGSDDMSPNAYDKGGGLLVVIGGALLVFGASASLVGW